jgi:cytochrome P450
MTDMPRRGTSILADYLPPDTMVLTSYADVYEAIRSPKMRPEPLHATQQQLVGGSVMTLTGSEHVHRRRTMNALVRPSALESYRENITIPTLQARLRAIPPGEDGTYRVDLVPFLKRCFVEFATSLIGLLDDGDDETRRDYLAEVSEGLHLGFHAKWMREDRTPFISAGQKAKAAYEFDFYTPGLARLRETSDVQDSLLNLLAHQADPGWADPDVALHESILLLIGTVETSATIITHTIAELDGWFAIHPGAQNQAKTDVEFLGRAIQETLRLNPVQPHIVRVALEDMKLADGTQIKQGQWVASLTRQANTDPAVFGTTATTYDPNREVPPGVPRYGVGFGAGPHQCLGLRIVLGNTGAGSHAHALLELYRAGVSPDRSRAMRRENSDRGHFEEFVVVFEDLASY